MKISVIIPTLNEERRIEPCLESLEGQRCEVIVVDGGSKDRTRRIARGYADKVFLKRGNVSVAKNHGVQKATGEWIVFVDADSRVSPDYIHRLRERIAMHPDADGFCVRHRAARRTFLAKIWEADSVIQDEVSPHPNVYLKRIFPSFRESLSFGEDIELWDWLENTYLKFIPCPEIVQTHDSKNHLWEYEAHMRWYGRYHSIPTWLWMLTVIPFSLVKAPVKFLKTRNLWAFGIPIKDAIRLYYQIKIMLGR